MDPFDELTRFGTSTSPSTQNRGLSPPPSVYQNQGTAAQPMPQVTQSTGAATGGNPFVDMPTQTAATPPRARPPRASAFQVCTSKSRDHLPMIAHNEPQGTLGHVQDLLPTQFSGASRGSNASPMKAGPATMPSNSALSATTSPGFAPLSAGLQVITPDHPLLSALQHAQPVYSYPGWSHLYIPRMAFTAYTYTYT